MQKTLVALTVLLAVVPAGARGDDPLAEVTQRIEGRTRRASSGLYDPESNRDAYHIGAGETRRLTTLDGPGEIRHMWFTIAGRDRRYPRTLVLRIYWDGAEVPSVETPIGDFFAAGNGMRANVNSLPIQVTSYGRALNCYWRMPFRKTARIEMMNEGAHPLTVYWQFDWIELPRMPDDMLYFHARYRQEFPAKPFSPYVIFEGRGRGHYVGTVFSIQCSYGSWFGESDDRFYVDGEVEPSIVGTGCEDFFNDAWNLRLFTNDNTGVTIKEPNGEDCRFTAYRWHLRAPVIFEKSLKVDIERRSYALVTDPKTGESQHYDFKYRPDLCSSVAFWYQDTIAEPFDRFPPASERINAEVFVETADLAAELKTSEGVRARSRSNRVCNLKRALFVDCDRTGGWFDVPCTIEQKGKYSISVFQCLYRTGGIWKVTLRGPTGEILLDPAMDFYDPYLAWTENRPENFLYGTWLENKVGIHELPPGEYTARFESVGSNVLARDEDPEKPGLDCRLDGISLRRFPWDDLHGQMERYLADEEKLFAEMEKSAESGVGALNAAIERFRLDTGEYPRALGELIERPSRPSSSTGNWPYISRLAVDPWGQYYRYELPGRFRPDSFDVYSVRGDSRDPARWIGNWPHPFRIENAIEGEDLRIAGRGEDISTSKQELGIESIPPISQGRILFIRMRQPGDFIDLALPPGARPGRQTLKVRLVTSRDYGIIALKLNGAMLGDPVDVYSPAIETKWIDLGEVEIRAGENILRFEAAGRNPSSSGYYAGVDAVLLRPSRG
ncbi:MAG: DUF2961 domain-containing protein [Planctomycetes bacterium]|nr:DUF2961 domain-containing protein [Planctomycetota bacterium]